MKIDKFFSILLNIYFIIFIFNQCGAMKDARVPKNSILRIEVTENLFISSHHGVFFSETFRFCLIGIL